MFIRLFTYRLRVLLRNRSLLFWTFAFPIVLGLLFNLAFGDLDKIGGIEQSTVGIVSTNEANQKRFENVLKEIKQDGKVVFKSRVMTKKKAQEQLSDDKLSGYFTIDEKEIELFVSFKRSIESIFTKYEKGRNLIGNWEGSTARGQPAASAGELYKRWKWYW